MRQQYSIPTSTADESVELGRLIGQALQGGEVVELTSDIGGGKTTLTKGIVEGIGCKTIVTSPTFTVAKQYKGRQVELYHFDFYRLSDPGIVGAELQELLGESSIVIVIEWSDIAKPLLVDKELIRISIEKDKHDDSTRLFKITVPDVLEHVQHALKELK